MGMNNNNNLENMEKLFLLQQESTHEIRKYASRIRELRIL
jgi:hypothetical protein